MQESNVLLQSAVKAQVSRSLKSHPWGWQQSQQWLVLETGLWTYHQPHNLWVQHWNCISPKNITMCAGWTVSPNKCWRGNEQGFKRVVINRQKGHPRWKGQKFLRPIQFAVSSWMSHVLILSCPSSHGEGKGIHQTFVLWVHQSMAEVVGTVHVLLSHSTEDSMWNDALEILAVRTIYYLTRYSIQKWCQHLHAYVTWVAGKGGTQDKYALLLDGYHNLIEENQHWENGFNSFECGNGSRVWRKPMIAHHRGDDHAECLQHNPIKDKACYFF